MPRYAVLSWPMLITEQLYIIGVRLGVDLIMDTIKTSVENAPDNRVLNLLTKSGLIVKSIGGDHDDHVISSRIVTSINE